VIDYKKIGEEVGQIVSDKQLAYGDSFGKAGEVLRLMYPEGVKPDQYMDMLAVVRIIDKLFRVATYKDAYGESPFSDITGYGLLGLANHLKARRKKDGLDK
jgi:hypothetical protein